MKAYKAEVIDAHKELTPRERIQMKEFSDSVRIVDFIANSEDPVITVCGYAAVHVTNEAADDPKDREYDKFQFLDSEGIKYSTSSKSLYEAVTDIYKELEGQDVRVRFCSKQSRNFKGGEFLTAVLV